MMRQKTRYKLITLLLIVVFFSSCLGVSADISLNQNGSGTIVLEYRINRALDALGRLDGNARWNTIPVGRSDFERTLDRLPEMRLISFSSNEDEKNLIIQVTMGFDSLQGLMAFFDASGLRSSFTGSGHSGNITMRLTEGRAELNPALNKLIAEISGSYSVRMSMSFPGEGNLTITGTNGLPGKVIPGSEIRAQGRQVFFSIPLYEVLSSSEGITAIFSW